MGRLKEASRPSFKARKGPEANQPGDPRRTNKTKKSFCVKFRRKSAVRHPIFKPVGLPEF
jgi:hypothetical protein